MDTAGRGTYPIRVLDRWESVVGSETSAGDGASAAVRADATCAEELPEAAPDQAGQLRSEDPQLAANKKLVFDMWRAIIQGGRTELAPRYFTEQYIQHNPNVASGRDALVAYIRQTRPARPIEPRITFPVVAIVAEGDLVMVATVTYAPDPERPGRKYAGTHFDLFRIERGKIAEHWDSVRKDAAMLHFDPNVDDRP